MKEQMKYYTVILLVILSDVIQLAFYGLIIWALLKFVGVIG